MKMRVFLAVAILGLIFLVFGSLNRMPQSLSSKQFGLSKKNKEGATPERTSSAVAPTPENSVVNNRSSQEKALASKANEGGELALPKISSHQSNSKDTKDPSDQIGELNNLPTINVKSDPLIARSSDHLPTSEVSNEAKFSFAKGRVRVGKRSIDPSAPCEPAVPQSCVSRSAVSTCPDSLGNEQNCDAVPQKFAVCDANNPNVESPNKPCHKRKIFSANSCTEKTIGEFSFCEEQTDDAEVEPVRCFLKSSDEFVEKTGINPKTKRYFNECDRPINQTERLKLRSSSSPIQLTRALRAVCKARSAVMIKKGDATFGRKAKTFPCRPSYR